MKQCGETLFGGRCEVARHSDVERDREFPLPSLCLSRLRALQTKRQLSFRPAWGRAYGGLLETPGLSGAGTISSRFTPATKTAEVRSNQDVDCYPQRQGHSA